MAYGTPFGDEVKAGLFRKAITSAVDTLEKTDAEIVKWKTKKFATPKERHDWHDSFVKPAKLKENAKMELISEIFSISQDEINKYIHSEINRRKEKRNR